MEAIIFLFLIIFVSALIASIFTYFRNKAFKEEIVAGVLSNVLVDVQYGITKGFDRKMVFDTQLVNKGNRYSSSDYVKGSYEGVHFEFANVEIEDTYEVDDTTHTDTYFKGQWLIFKTDRSIHEKLYMIDKDFRFSTPHRGWFFTSNDLQKVESESIGFNKEFKVYAKDPQEAFYILSPQRILSFYERHRENVSFYLNESTLHVAIYSNKFIFNDKWFSSESNLEKQKRVERELFNVLDYLKILE